jgi:hypothetical protein
MVLVMSSHHLYYPAQVALLSAEGKLLREYWHSGRFERVALTDLDGDGANEIYLGGVNNGHERGTLIVLDPERFGGASDEHENPDYQLEGFPPPKERARILFPSSCVAKAGDVWSAAMELFVYPGAVMVEVWQQPHAAQAPLFYRFDRELKVVSMTVGDGFTLAHRRLEAEGKVTHRMTDDEVAALRKVEYLVKR